MKHAFLAIVLLFVPGTIVAQDGAAVEGGDVVVEAAAVAQPAMIIGGGPKQIESAKRFQLTQVFAVEVEEISRICELDDAQVTKLTVGAKGAVKKLTAEWMKTTGQMFGGIDPAEQVDDDAGRGDPQAGQKQEVEISDADQIDEMAIQAIVMGNDGNPFIANQPTENEFWQKTLASVLSESQSSRWAQHRAEQSVAKQRAQAALCMDSLNRELGLSEDQKAKLSSLVTPLIEKANVNCFAFYETFLIYYHASKVAPESLNEILSPAQVQKWKLFMSPAREIGQMMEAQAQGAIAVQVEGQAIEIKDDK